MNCRCPACQIVLTSDLRMSLASGLDNKVVDDLISALTAVDVGAGADLTTAALLAGVHGVVDGRAARYFNEVLLLAGNSGPSTQTTAFARESVRCLPQAPSTRFSIGWRTFAHPPICRMRPGVRTTSSPSRREPARLGSSFRSGGVARCYATRADSS